MKLKKRIAIGAMAAVLAAAMLAGCGGAPAKPSTSTGGNHAGTGGGSSSSSSSSSTSTGDKKDDTATPPKEDGNKKDDAQLETRTEKFFSGKYVINKTKWMYVMQRTHAWYEENRTSTTIYTVATDGRRSVIKTELDSGDLTEIEDWKEKQRYDFNSAKAGGYVDIHPWQENPSSTKYGFLGYDILYQGVDQPSLREWADQREIGTYQVDGVKYYSETYTRNYEQGYQEQMIYCFDVGDKEGRNLRYYINLTRKDGKLLGMDKYKMIKISSDVDINLLRVPEGRTIYRRVGDSGVVTNEKTPKDNYPN